MTLQRENCGHLQPTLTNIQVSFIEDKIKKEHRKACHTACKVNFMHLHVKYFYTSLFMALELCLFARILK